VYGPYVGSWPVARRAGPNFAADSYSWEQVLAAAAQHGLPLHADWKPWQTAAGCQQQEGREGAAEGEGGDEGEREGGGAGEQDE
jgi:hypothetical protein